MTSASTAHAPENLREQTLTSVFWVVVFTVVKTLALFLVPAGIAWLGGALELGIAQIALGIYMVALPFVTLGTRAAVLQQPTLDQAYLSSVFYLNLATGALTAAVLGFGAPWLASLGGHDPRLVVILRGMGVVCLGFSLTVVQGALLARRLAFRTVSLINIASAVAAGVAGLGAAALGWRLGALAVAAAAFLVVTNTALWFSGRWRPSPTFSLRAATAALRFGITASLATFANNLASQLERFLIAWLFGPTALGLYGAARNLGRDTLRNVLQVSDEILLPGLAGLQGDLPRARAYYLAAVRYEFVACAPVAVFIAVFAHDLVWLVYGRDWLSIVPFVQVLTPLILFTTTNHTIGAVFLAVGRPDRQLHWSVLSIPLVASYVAIGSPWGLSGVITTLSCLEGLGWLISHRMANRLIGLEMRTFLGHLARPAAVLIVFAATLTALRWWLDRGGVPRWDFVGAGAVGAAIVYVVLLDLLARSISRTAWQAAWDMASHIARRRNQG